MTVLKGLLVVLVGLSSGWAVGSGLVAFLTVLDIIPRLAQMSHSLSYVRWLEWAIVSGAVSFSVIDLFSVRIDLPVWTTAGVGLIAGLFVGMLAAGLTEVLNVFPILAKRLRMERYILGLLMAMVFGKVAGSLLQWLLQL